MPPMHAAQRPRFFHLCIKGSTPQHGHCIEYTMSIINTLVQFGFLWGSYLFLGDEDDLRFGDVLFILGSFITFVFAAYNLIESRNHWLNYYAAEREDRIEFWEVSMFFLAGLVFFVGSLFYWPGVYQNWICQGCTETAVNDWEFWGESWGAFLFVMGSLMFVCASMFNAIGLGMNKYEDDQTDPVAVRVHYIHLIALISSQLGSTCFVVGSFLYRPVFPACPALTERYAGQAQTGQEVAEEACESTGTAGTWLYVYGSYFYILEALLNFTSTALKGASSNEKVGHKAVPDDEDSN